ncbi:MAG TPA: transcription initiation factor TFIIIB, partial [Candidatus Avamphibacillus intestinigallinarum]|nr:transcription initiation factor TFIIIB [Candidatus Avamphibacillus intestinigallinarum]
NIGRAKQSGYAAVNVKGALLGKAMIHYFCKDCGFVIESYIHKPRP